MLHKSQEVGVYMILHKQYNIQPQHQTTYEIRENALKLLKSYLTDRTQYVTYDGLCSSTKPVQCGVPQGSILGPLLFIITMTDIGNVSDFLHSILYADDTCVGCVLLNRKKFLNLVKLLNSELDKLSIWLNANKISLNQVNVKKSYYMVFHRAKIKLDKHAAIKVNGVSLQCTNSFKYLGVIITHKLNWTQHIAHVKNKVSKGIGIMYRARNYLTKSILKSLYFHTYIPI